MRSLLALTLFFMTPVVFAAKSSTSGSSGTKFEVRAHYSIYQTDASNFDTKMGSYFSGVPEVGHPAFLGLDALYKPGELILGIRLESIITKPANTLAAQTDGSSKKLESTWDAVRMGVLVGWRPITGRLGYLGLITHVMASSVDYKIHATNISTNATEDQNFKGTSDISYGGGVEFGVYVESRIKAGFEIGYSNFKVKSFETSSGSALTSNGQNVGIDFSGVYGKFMVAGEF